MVYIRLGLTPLMDDFCRHERTFNSSPTRRSVSVMLGLNELYVLGPLYWSKVLFSVDYRWAVTGPNNRNSVFLTSLIFNEVLHFYLC